MGTSPVALRFSFAAQDHPHAYGDKSETAISAIKSRGSSPRVWGQEIINQSEEVQMRIIPTRMGTSSRRYVSRLFDLDHPHAYGDKLFFCLHARLLGGSSPRVWGQAAQLQHRTSQRGIIPTRMGTRSCSKSAYASREDHPHAYGDKFSFCINQHRSAGSSPRVWGQDSCRYKRTRNSRDHPHAYGDKRYYRTNTQYILGSSPRVWGQV